MPLAIYKFSINKTVKTINDNCIKSTQELSEKLQLHVERNLYPDKRLTLEVNLLEEQYSFEQLLVDFKAFFKQSDVLIDLEVQNSHFSIEHATIISEIPNLISLKIDSFAITPQVVQKVSKSPLLQHLHLSPYSFENDEDWKPAFEGKCSNSLNHVTLENFSIDSTDVLTVFSNFLQDNPQIISLSLKDGVLSSKMLPLFNTLEKLEIIPADSEEIQDICKITSLQKIHFTITEEENDDLDFPVEAAQDLLNNPNLTELSLSQFALKKGVVSTLAKSTTLKKLDLSQVANFDYDPSDVSEDDENEKEGFTDEIKELAQNPHIRELILKDLFNYTYSEESLTILLANKNICYLNLDGSPGRYDDESIKIPDYIIDAIFSLNNLEYLSLLNVRIEDENESETKFPAFINALFQTPIRTLILEAVSVQNLEKLCKLPLLENLSVRTIICNNEMGLKDNWETIIATIENSNLLSFQYMELEGSVNSFTNSLLPDPFFIKKALLKNCERRKQDLPNYLNRYETLLRGWFDQQSILSKLPFDILKDILFASAVVDTLPWKDQQQRIGFVECLTNGFFNNFVKTEYKKSSIKVTEKLTYPTERTFQFSHKPLNSNTTNNSNNNNNKRSLEENENPPFPSKIAKL